MSRPGYLSATAHRVQQLVISAQIQLFVQRGLDPFLDAIAAAHATVGDIGTHTLGQQQQFSITQQRRCATVPVTLIVDAFQAVGQVGVHDLVGSLVGVPGNWKHLCVRATFCNQSEELTTTTFDSAGTARVDDPELVGLVLKGRVSDNRKISD